MGKKGKKAHCYDERGREGYAMSEKACLHARRHKPEREGIGTSENRQEGARTGEKRHEWARRHKLCEKGHEPVLSKAPITCPSVLGKFVPNFKQSTIQKSSPRTSKVTSNSKNREKAI